MGNKASSNAADKAKNDEVPKVVASKDAPTRGYEASGGACNQSANPTEPLSHFHLVSTPSMVSLEPLSSVADDSKKVPPCNLETESEPAPEMEGQTHVQEGNTLDNPEIGSEQVQKVREDAENEAECPMESENDGDVSKLASLAQCMLEPISTSRDEAFLKQLRSSLNAGTHSVDRVEPAPLKVPRVCMSRLQLLSRGYLGDQQTSITGNTTMNSDAAELPTIPDIQQMVIGDGQLQQNSAPNQLTCGSLPREGLPDSNSMSVDL